MIEKHPAIILVFLLFGEIAMSLFALWIEHLIQMHLIERDFQRKLREIRRSQGRL